MEKIKEHFEKTFGKLFEKEPLLSVNPSIYSPFRPSYGTPNIQKCLLENGKYKCSAIQWIYRQSDLPSTYNESKYHYSLFRMCCYDRLSLERKSLLEDVNKWCDYLLRFLNKDKLMAYYTDGTFKGMSMKTLDIVNLIEKKGIKTNKIKPKPRQSVYFGRQEGAWGPQFEFCYKTNNGEVEVGFFADMRFDRRDKNANMFITDHVNDLYETENIKYSETNRQLFISAIGFERLYALSKEITFRNIYGWKEIIDFLGTDDLSAIKMANLARVVYYLLCDGCEPKAHGNMGANRKFSKLLKNLAVLSIEKDLYDRKFMKDLFNEVKRIAINDYPVYSGGSNEILLDYLFGDTVRIHLDQVKLSDNLSIPLLT